MSTSILCLLGYAGWALFLVACVAFALAVDGQLAVPLESALSLASLVSLIEGSVRRCEVSGPFPVDIVYDMGLRRL